LTITPILKAYFADETTSVLSVATEPIRGGMGEGVGIQRVFGAARVQNALREWSVVCKILSPKSGGRKIRDWNYWRLALRIELFSLWP